MNEIEAKFFAHSVTENHFLCWKAYPEWQTGDFTWKKFLNINDTNLHTQARLKHVQPDSSTYELIMTAGRIHCENILKQNNLL